MCRTTEPPLEDKERGHLVACHFPQRLRFEAMSWRDPRDGNPVKAALAAGESVVGTFVRIPTVEAVEICAHAGCQFLIIDNEHTPVDWERTAAMILAAEAAGTTSILRLPTWGRERITKALDAGADGVMIPQVEEGRVTADVVAATRYGPERHAGRGHQSQLGLRDEDVPSRIHRRRQPITSRHRPDRERRGREQEPTRLRPWRGSIASSWACPTYR